eukprot:182456_1
MSQSHNWGIDKSWGISNPFKFSSRANYAPTISSDGTFFTNTSRQTHNSRSHMSHFGGPFRHYSTTDFADLKSLRSSDTIHSSSRPKHHYYESVESLPSTSTIPHILPSSSLNPPKIVKKWYQTPLVWIKALSFCALLTFFILSLSYAHSASVLFEPYLSNIESTHSWGMALFAIMLFVSIVFLIPQTLFIIDGCLVIVHIWGTPKGILITVCMVWTVNFIGSVTCYFYGRFLMYKPMKRLLQHSDVIRLVEKNVFDIHGWKFVLLLRLLPMNSYNVMNYALGCTSLDLCGFIIGSLGMLPNIILYCLIAIYCPSKQRIDHVLLIVMIVQLVVAITAVVWWILWIYWNISNQIYNQSSARASMFGNRIMNQTGDRQSKNTKKEFTIVRELSDNVSDL